jgi:hypothetical protein
MEQHLMKSASTKPLIFFLGAVAIFTIGFLARGQHTSDPVPQEAIPADLTHAEEFTLAPTMALGNGETTARKALLADAPPPSPAAQSQFMRERLAELDAIYSATPTDPSWATAMQGKITSAISKSIVAAKMDSQDAISQETECRSNACRVSFVFNDGEGEDLTPLVLLQLSSDFPGSVTVPIRHEDGATEYFLYLVNNKNNPLMGKSKLHPLTNRDNG